MNFYIISAITDQNQTKIQAIIFYYQHVVQKNFKDGQQR